MVQRKSASKSNSPKVILTSPNNIADEQNSLIKENFTFPLGKLRTEFTFNSLVALSTNHGVVVVSLFFKTHLILSVSQYFNNSS